MCWACAECCPCMLRFGICCFQQCTTVLATYPSLPLQPYDSVSSCTQHLVPLHRSIPAVLPKDQSIALALSSDDLHSQRTMGRTGGLGSLLILSLHLAAAGVAWAAGGEETSGQAVLRLPQDLATHGNASLYAGNHQYQAGRRSARSADPLGPCLPAAPHSTRLPGSTRLKRVDARVF